MLNERKLDSGSTWIDLLDPTEEEMDKVASEHGIRVPTRAQLDEIESSSRLAREDDVLYLSMPVATIADDGSIVPSPMGFILSDKLIVTIHFRAPAQHGRGALPAGERKGQGLRS